LSIESRGEILQYRIKNISGKKVAISGLLGESGWESALTSLPMEFWSADLIFILMQGPAEFSKSIIARYPKVDLVFNGEGKGDNIRPYNDGYIVDIGRSHAGVGILKLEILPSASAPLRISGFDFITTLIDDPPPKPGVKAFVDEYYERWFKVLEKKRKEYVGTDKVFLGVKFCGKCHQEEFQSWSNTSHSKAYQSLKNLENRCLPCHTTGFGYPTGFWTIDWTPKLAGVGCEECHIIKDKSHIKGKHTSQSVTIENCKCHKPPHDNDFDFSRDVVKVRH
jgi:hypothetical protein